jgi:hypothetical protein
LFEKVFVRLVLNNTLHRDSGRAIGIQEIFHETYCFRTKRDFASLDSMFARIYETMSPIIKHIVRVGILLMNEVVHCDSDSEAITHEWTIAETMIAESVFFRRREVHDLLEELAIEIDLVWSAPRVNC